MAGKLPPTPFSQHDGAYTCVVGASNIGHVGEELNFGAGDYAHLK